MGRGSSRLDSMVSGLAAQAIGHGRRRGGLDSVGWHSNGSQDSRKSLERYPFCPTRAPR